MNSACAVGPERVEMAMRKNIETNALNRVYCNVFRGYKMKSYLKAQNLYVLQHETLHFAKKYLVRI